MREAWFRADAGQPEVVGAYLAAAGEGYAAPTLRRRVAAIARACGVAGYPLDTKHPAIRETLRGIARKRGAPARRSAALTTAEVKRLSRACGTGLAGARDRALFLVGFAGAMRRSELVALGVEHVTWTHSGMKLLIARSKNDAEGKGAEIAIPRGSSPETCPVTALQQWLTAAEISAGPVFRKVNCGGTVETARLVPDAVRQIQILRQNPGKTIAGTFLALGLVFFALGLVFLMIKVGGIGSTGVPSTAAPPTPVALDADAVQGHVLPFKIISAIRNFGFKEGMIPAQISVSVEGGGPADWAATAIYIAEHSIVNGAFYSVVEVYVPNPWGDMPPQQYKKLAQVFYAPDPAHSPWGKDDTWTILPAAKAGTLADIEFDKLGGDLLSDKIGDPDRRAKIADAQARRIVINKYHLSSKWQPTEGLGLTGASFRRSHVDVLSRAG